MGDSGKFVDKMDSEVRKRINELIKVGWAELGKLNLIAVRETAEEIITVSNKNSYDKGFMVGYYLHGLVEINLNRFDLALDFYFKALNAILKTDDKDSISISYENLGRCYGRLGNYNECLQYFLKADELSCLQQSASKCS